MSFKAAICSTQSRLTNSFVLSELSLLPPRRRHHTPPPLSGINNYISSFDAKIPVIVQKRKRLFWEGSWRAVFAAAAPSQIPRPDQTLRLTAYKNSLPANTTKKPHQTLRSPRKSDIQMSDKNQSVSATRKLIDKKIYSPQTLQLAVLRMSYRFLGFFTFPPLATLATPPMPPLLSLIAARSMRQSKAVRQTQEQVQVFTASPSPPRLLLLYLSPPLKTH